MPREIFSRRLPQAPILALFALLLPGCAGHLQNFSSRVDELPPADVILFGEQHGAPEHHDLERRLVDALAQRGRLAAVAMEMADSGKSTADLKQDADETEVRAALAWSDSGWPWKDYGPVVMAAVRAGVPVVGTNLPRSAMRPAMANEALDTHLPAAALAQQRERIRDGHCDMLPPGQIAPMTRIQIARDASMAGAITASLQSGKTVLFIAGGGHVARSLGVPTHLQPTVRQVVVLAKAGKSEAGAAQEADVVWPTPALPPVDHCAALRQQFAPKPAP